ncbi:MAG: hypothetical protein IH846_16865 [Acidobacteria bacterium]|nr:hypothetical protein [Acidobacteriota bacterium]
MTVLCRRCGKEKLFEQYWWELRNNRAEGTVQVVQFQYYWSDRDAQFCSRRCLLENLEDYCKQAEERVQASSATEAPLPVNAGAAESQSPATIAPHDEDDYQMIMNEVTAWMDKDEATEDQASNVL